MRWCCGDACWFFWLKGEEANRLVSAGVVVGLRPARVCVAAVGAKPKMSAGAYVSADIFGVIGPRYAGMEKGELYERGRGNPG
jgi:hypothetical protein